MMSFDSLVRNLICNVMKNQTKIITFAFSPVHDHLFKSIMREKRSALAQNESHYHVLCQTNVGKNEAGKCILMIVMYKLS